MCHKQVRALLDKAHAVSKIWNDAPIVICGDFNCTPKVCIYYFLLELFPLQFLLSFGFSHHLFKFDSVLNIILQ